jgi:hypothetical protein
MNARFLKLEKLYVSGALIGLLAGAALFGACSSEENNEPKRPVITGGTGGGGTGGTAGTAGTGGSTAGTGGTLGDAGPDGSGSDATAPCVYDAGPTGCVACPVAPGDFLKQCSAAFCSRFDNSRITGFDGSLPPLP